MTVQFVAGRNLIHSLATKPMPLIACGLLGTWFILCLAMFSGRAGDDLSPLYFAARFIADGRIDHVFSHDPLFFHMVNDPVWTAEAARTSFTGHAHPFVQAPIWAWMVSPLATNLSFPEFNALFLVVNIAGAIGALILAIMAWHPRLLAPIPLAALITLVSLSQPFRYNLFLNQTQSLVFFLTMLAILLVQRRRPAAAGAALAFASLIKILPVALAVYWFITGRRAAAVWTGIFLIASAVLSLAVLGPALNGEYVHRLVEISGIVVMGNNNQSFTAWLLNAFASNLLDWRMEPLPLWAKALNLGAAAATVLLFVLRLRNAPLEHRDIAATAMILLVTTIFSPIAWTHYYIVLSVVSVAILRLYGGGGVQEWAGWLLLGMVWLLNMKPFAPHVTQSWSSPWIWAHLYSGILALVMLYAAPGLSSTRAFVTAREAQAIT